MLRRETVLPGRRKAETTKCKDTQGEAAITRADPPGTPSFSVSPAAHLPRGTPEIRGDGSRFQGHIFASGTLF